MHIVRWLLGATSTMVAVQLLTAGSAFGFPWIRPSILNPRSWSARDSSTRSAPRLAASSITASIATRFFSIEARYAVGGLFGDDTKRITGVVRAHRTEIGVAAMTAYGFEEGTQEIVLEKDRPNAITMLLTVEVEASTVCVHTLDATTHVERAGLKNIPLEIAM